MKNFAKFNCKEIEEIFFDAKLINFNPALEVIGVSTDSRTLDERNIFVAILGEKFDGHNSMKEAILRGASAAIISYNWYSKKNIIDYNIPLIVVNDTLEALGRLANFHRRRFNHPIIAVCGSNGKTTTKDLIASVLSIKYNVLKTFRNFNNRIGVPLMLFQLSNKYNIAVLELGTSMPGEIEILTNMVDPTDGIITNIGLEHLEMFVDIHAVEIEESYLFEYLENKKRRCFINKDDERLVKYEEITSNHFTFGMTENAEFSVKVEFDLGLAPILYLYDDATKETNIVRINSIGLAAAYNSIAAAAVGYCFGLGLLEIAEGFSNFVPDTTCFYARMVLENYKHLYILNDTYNANPSSMELSIYTLHKFLLGHRKIAILGDMAELGIHSNYEHIKIIKYALEYLDEVIVVGNNMREAAYKILAENNTPKLKTFNNYYEIGTYFRTLDVKIIKSAAVLVKGSRVMEMENLIKILKTI